jgi:hypothetical protein
MCNVTFYLPTTFYYKTELPFLLLLRTLLKYLTIYEDEEAVSHI